jgi:AraC-like DNA-binding protein
MPSDQSAPTASEAEISLLTRVSTGPDARNHAIAGHPTVIKQSAPGRPAGTDAAQFQKDRTMPSLDELRSAATEALLHWDFEQDPAVTRGLQLRSRLISDIRISDVAGGPCRGQRSSVHTSYDNGDYVGLVCRIEGEEICRNAEGEVRVNKGDLLLWRNRGDLSFQTEGWTRKLIMLIPESRFATVLRKPFDTNSMVLPGTSGLGLLTSSFMVALCENLDQIDGKEAEIAVEMALDLVASLYDSTLHDEGLVRTTLFERIIRHIDRNLEDVNLSPADIAAAHGISRRYLHLVFAQQGHTVSGWIRERRLLRCRNELLQTSQKPSMTEIAHRWGYSDSAHFSRSFKKRFGMPPRSWRDLQESTA